MKNLKINLMLLLFSIVLISCEKEENDPIQNTAIPSSSNQSQDFIQLSNEEYQLLQNNLESDFQSESGPKQPATSQQNNIVEKDISEYPPLEVNPLNIKELIQKQKAIKSNYPELKNFTSMLDVYHQALLLDKKDRRKFVNKYNYFLVLIEEFDFVMLSIPKYKAAMLSPEGLIQIENEIIQYSEQGVKVIKSGNKELIPELEKTIKSNTEIQVFSTQNNQNKAINIYSETGVQYNSFSSLFAIGYVKYLDLNYQLGSLYYSRAGVNVATFFNGQPNAVSIFNLATKSISYASPGQSCNGWAFPNGTRDFSNLTNTGLNWTHVDITLACPSGLNISYVNVNTDFAVIYANGFPFSGNIQ